MSLVDYPNGAIATLLTLITSAVAVLLFRNFGGEDKEFLVNVFIAALMIRIVFGVIVYSSSMQDFFGGDSVTYDALGQRLVELWQGTADPTERWSMRATNTNDPGWGMNYLVGAMYFVFGRSILAAQSFCAVIGAATAPMVFFCAKKIFNNTRVAKNSALAIAFFPSFIIWSAQLMKDGLIIFLLVFTMTMVLQLQKKFGFLTVTAMILAMFGILSLRFYIFYMVAVAVAGSFVIGLGTTAKSIFRRLMAVAVIGLGLTYLGVLRNAGAEYEKYGNLEKVQQSRQDLSRAESGFGGDLDVSTTEGAITAIPVGLVYLMLAPFPWQISNVRQAITLPEIFVWWACIPLLISGLWYAVKNRLREGVPVLLFSLMLTLAYSIFQGNVGTAYRQRTQIQVFLFIFISVGWTLLQEKKENKKILRQAEREKQFKRRAEIAAS